MCAASNISKEDCKICSVRQHVRVIHQHHQKSIGVAGVSDKYGWARYPALWTLKHVDSLPNPDPSDSVALDEKPVDLVSVKVDRAAEAARPEQKRQAQAWAGITQDPSADLFVFVSRCSKQKGIDLIADSMPSLWDILFPLIPFTTVDFHRLEKRKSIQLIAVGPVIDLYGRFAAEKLARLMELFPGRVSKPEFTALPPYIFSGADFALIPSRDEPFGLVAVEFGRKGALGVGSQLGGLGLSIHFFQCLLFILLKYYCSGTLLNQALHRIYSLS
jgi:alpha-1,3-glucan synthase